MQNMQEMQSDEEIEKTRQTKREIMRKGHRRRFASRNLPSQGLRQPQQGEIWS